MVTRTGVWMIGPRHLLSSAAILAAAACQRPAEGPAERVAPRPVCPAAWEADWSADSAVAVCLPPGFAEVVPPVADGFHRWARPLRFVGAAQGDWLSVSVDSAGTPAGPPRLGSGPPCSADCYTVDSVSDYRETVGGLTAAVQVGLVSGGMPDFRRQPMLVAAWETPGGARVSVDGLAAAPAMIDTLRAMLRTVRLSGR